MGATIFAFRMEKGNLKTILEQIEHQEKLYPGRAWGWEFSVDLVPDGFGYEIREIEQKMVSLDETSCLTNVVVSEKQRNLN